MFTCDSIDDKVHLHYFLVSLYIACRLTVAIVLEVIRPLSMSPGECYQFMRTHRKQVIVSEAEKTCESSKYERRRRGQIVFISNIHLHTGQDEKITLYEEK